MQASMSIYQVVPLCSLFWEYLLAWGVGIVACLESQHCQKKGYTGLGYEEWCQCGLTVDVGGWLGVKCE